MMMNESITKQRNVNFNESQDDERNMNTGDDEIVRKQINENFFDKISLIRNVKDKINSLSPRWRSFVIRTITTLIMCGSIIIFMKIGPAALIAMIMTVQLTCFSEIINIGYRVYKDKDLPLFRLLSWYFVFTSNYFLFGEGIIVNFRILLAKEDFLQSLITHHRFISYCLYMFGFVMFVLNLVKKHYMQQFALFSWTHLFLLIVVTSSHCMMNNVFHGMVWFIVPISLIAFNDIMAYLFGYFFGRTPLIKLSPKKTWEGFIGGAVTTLLLAIIMPYVLLQFDSCVCPLEYDDVKGVLSLECERNSIFKPITYKLPAILSFLPFKEIIYYEFLKHSIILGIFSSVVAPFGGFFASGLKRALKIKDFSDTIPGHGGIIDRIDCQVMMGIFVYLYYTSFVQTRSISSVLQQILSMPPNDQMEFYQKFKNVMLQRGMINP